MLEFEGAFQEAEVFVNGIAVGSHRGGYTGFPIDITSAVRPGRNVVAVRVNNIWKATQAPRAGEHVFSGGIYRDVWLVATDAVHVPWTGTYVTTPGVDKGVARVSVESEVRNDGPTPATVVAATEVIDDKGRRVSRLPSETLLMPAGGIKTLRQLSPQIATPRLWTPETPTLYRVVTTLSVDGKVRDRFETPFGFRWFRWTADQGFFLNGKHRYFKGANVHQDHAGWGDAVTDGAIVRDVTLMKDAGFDFIRGSHYPHDPAFTDATDRLGLLFLSEAPFWGTGGFKEGGKWESPAYPTEAADRPAFEASVRQQLTEMIRIHRNHPSILGWSMGNETFFSAPESMPELRRFLKDLVALSHQLDPTRVAVIGGAQRGDIDKLGDVAAYNGDGATLFLNPGVPSMVSEYGSGIAHRPGEYVPTWGDLPKAAPKDGSPYPWRFPWRSGEAVWAGFDHGSIAGREFGSMGIIDYARLPKRVYYWYRNAYRGVAPPAWPKPGKAAALRITASAPKLTHADGTDDLQLIVTVIDAQGRAISNSPPVHLAIEAGPGELPTGRTIDFTPTGDIPIRDGQAAISMRSWQAGISRLRATSPGLADGTLDIATTDGPRFVAGVTPIVAEQPYVPPTARAGEEAVFGVDNPTGASSTAPGQSPRMANDGDAATWWSPAPGDNDPWVSISTERILRFRSVEVTFPQAGGYGFIVEVARPDGRWELLARQAPGTVTTQVRRVDTSSSIGERIRVKPITPKGLPVGVAEVRIFATLETR